MNRPENEIPKLPVEPLLEVLAMRYPSTELCARFDSRAVEKMGMSAYLYGRRPYVTIYTADQIALKLGLHPYEIWHNWYDMPELQPVDMHGLTEKQMGEALGMKQGSIRAWKRSGIWTPLAEWIAEQVKDYEGTPDGRFARTARHEPLEECGLSLEELAELHGVDESTVRRWRKGGVCPTRNETTRSLTCVPA